MQEEDNVNLDTQNETVEETVENPEVETTEETLETETVVDAEQLQATNKKLYERAKKAEAELKALKGSTFTKKPAEAKVSPQPSNVDERILLANGMSKELLNELKAVAQIRKLDLLEAQSDPIFVAVKEKFEKDKRQKEASLPASRGAGSVKSKKDFFTPGLTREEHMALAKNHLK